MPVVEDAINVLNGLLGTGEDPPGSNHNEITEFYADVSGQEWARRGNPWCMMTMTYVFQHIGFSWFVYAYCPFVERDARNGVNGMSWSTQPVVGAMVLYDLNGKNMATHVGMMVVWVEDDGSFWTIEGNWRDGTFRLHRDMKYVRGFAVMPFDNVSGTIPFVPAPPAQQQTGGRPVLRVGSRGESVKLVQNVCINAGIDIGPDGADGDFGNNTKSGVQELQRRLGVGDDGIVGPETWEALDRFFAWLASSNGQAPAPSAPGSRLEEDGVLGPETIKAIQRIVGVDDDGVMGRGTISAMQSHLGTSVDGKISRPYSEMVAALQGRVGAAVDGELGPDTILHLQQTINATQTF